MKSIISKKIQLFELIYSNLTNFKNIVRKGRKTYYFSRYTKVYRLISIDEAESMFFKFEVENELNRKIKIF